MSDTYFSKNWNKDKLIWGSDYIFNNQTMYH